MVVQIVCSNVDSRRVEDYDTPTVAFEATVTCLIELVQTKVGREVPSMRYGLTLS